MVCGLLIHAAHSQIIEYFASLNIHILELFGQSECTGPHTFNTVEGWKMGTCGRPMVVSDLTCPDLVSYVDFRQNMRHFRFVRLCLLVEGDLNEQWSPCSG